MKVWCVFDQDWDLGKVLEFISPTYDDALKKCQRRGLASEDGKLYAGTDIEEWNVE